MKPNEYEYGNIQHKLVFICLYDKIYKTKITLKYKYIFFLVFQAMNYNLLFTK